MIVMEEINSIDFWRRIGDSNPYHTLSGLALNAGVNYDYLRQQKSEKKIPNSIDLYRLSISTGKSMEFLLTGRKRESEAIPSLTPRIIRIVKSLASFATDEDFLLVERILRIGNKEELLQDEE